MIPTKKTLIALAALAAVGSAAAQATLSGKVGFGYETVAGNAADGTRGGFNITDGEFTLSATEDLGGGLKITAKTTLEAKGRQTAPATKDAMITVTGGFGTVFMGSIEHANANVAYGYAGAPVDTTTDWYDGNILATGKATGDTFGYVSPAFSGANFMLLYADDIGADVPGAGSGGGGATGIRGVLVGATYAAGPLAARLDHTQFDGVLAGADFNRTRLGASYDFGSFKIGAAYEDREYDTAGTRNAEDGQYLLGVSAPVGDNVRVGLIYASDDATNVDAWAIGVDYKLSKRTKVNFTYDSVDDGTAVESRRNDNSYSLKLIHSF